MIEKAHGRRRGEHDGEGFFEEGENGSIGIEQAAYFGKFVDDLIGAYFQGHEGRCVDRINFVLSKHGFGVGEFVEDRVFESNDIIQSLATTIENAVDFDIRIAVGVMLNVDVDEADEGGNSVGKQFG